VEPGYMFLATFFRTLGLGFWAFSISIKLIGYYAFLYHYRCFSNSYMWGVIYWFSSFAIFLWIDHPARNFIAMSIFIFSFKFLYRRNMYKYFSICILGSLFHSSCICMIPFYFIPNKLKVKWYKLALLLVLAVYLFSSMLRGYIDTIAQIQYFSKILSYGSDEYQGQMSIIRFIIIESVLFIAVCNIESLRRMFKYVDYIIILSFVYALLFSIANINTILFRLQLYFIIPFVVLTSFLCSNALKRKLRLCVRSFVVFFSFIYMLNLVSRDTRYVPYSNYTYYMFDNLSYDYRSQYNEKNSPYK
jgi:hypothetical protein